MSIKKAKRVRLKLISSISIHRSLSSLLLICLSLQFSTQPTILFLNHRLFRRLFWVLHRRKALQNGAQYRQRDQISKLYNFTNSNW
jgi:hypothetical protein